MPKPPKETTSLDFLTDNSVKYVLVLHFWLHKFAKRQYGFRKTTSMLLLMLYDIKRPIISNEWAMLNNSYSFSNSSADLMLLENKDMIRKKKVMTHDIEMVRKRAGNSKKLSLHTQQVQMVHAYRYEITTYGIQVADEIRKNIKHRVDFFSFKMLDSMKKF